MSFYGGNNDDDSPFAITSSSPRNTHIAHQHSGHHSSQYSTEFYERTKFVLIPDLDVDAMKQREIRDKWVKSLRLATKGAFLWDVLLNLKVENASNLDEGPLSNNNNTNYDNNISPKHGNSQTAFVSSHSSSPYTHKQHQYHSSSSSRNRINNMGGYHQSSRHQQAMSGHSHDQHNPYHHDDHSQSINTHNPYQYNRRQYSNDRYGSNNNLNSSSSSSARRKVGGNTQDYPDYHSSSNSNKSKNSGHHSGGYSYNPKSSISRNQY